MLRPALSGGWHPVAMVLSHCLRPGSCGHFIDRGGHLIGFVTLMFKPNY
jgi:hypothetical protein